jgi:hypothetical protein
MKTTNMAIRFVSYTARYSKTLLTGYSEMGKFIGLALGISINYTLVITLKPVSKVHNYIVSSFIIIYTSEILTQRC